MGSLCEPTGSGTVARWRVLSTRRGVLATRRSVLLEVRQTGDGGHGQLVAYALERHGCDATVKMRV